MYNFLGARWDLVMSLGMQGQKPLQAKMQVVFHFLGIKTCKHYQKKQNENLFQTSHKKNDNYFEDY